VFGDGIACVFTLALSFLASLRASASVNVHLLGYDWRLANQSGRHVQLPRASDCTMSFLRTLLGPDGDRKPRLSSLRNLRNLKVCLHAIPSFRMFAFVLRPLGYLLLVHEEHSVRMCAIQRTCSDTSTVRSCARALQSCSHEYADTCNRMHAFSLHLLVDVRCRTQVHAFPRGRLGSPQSTPRNLADVDLSGLIGLAPSR